MFGLGGLLGGADPWLISALLGVSAITNGFAAITGRRPKKGPFWGIREFDRPRRFAVGYAAIACAIASIWIGVAYYG